ncbi:SPOR domain-containing protein [Massilia norwichensis]|uniref:SPOR domain-containing protein n=1 Tax=Massilia norwichensis TaxID=1442366 RepID=A0ABT2ACG8_9BURK|nr:SPOR domain-containing protein [Massilia norwichensis]MCS0591908.1 SPOR domain-containing protein [Massilia norwichensis]
MTAFRSSTNRACARQRGSTLTGLIIGLIVGLGIAVAVALTITKGASPFTEKIAKSGRPADPAPGQAMDPNKPMYSSREAVREANKEVTEKAAARSARPAEPAVAAAPAPVAPAAPAASADPLGQAIASIEARQPGASARDSHPVAAPAAAPAAAAPAAAAGTGEYVYFLQAGAFRNMPDAEATRAKLALLGFEAAISDSTRDSGVLHHVRLGPYNQVESMNKARAKLLDNGVDVAIVRKQR